MSTMIGLDEPKLDFPNRREHVRVYYPLSCLKKFMPVLILHSRSYQVMDISEKGLRFANPNSNLIPNSMLSVVLQFPDGSTVSVVGKVVRRVPKQIALRLENGIPYTRIMSEQFRLRKLVVAGAISYNDR